MLMTRLFFHKKSIDKIIGRFNFLTIIMKHPKLDLLIQLSEENWCGSSSYSERRRRESRDPFGGHDRST